MPTFCKQSGWFPNPFDDEITDLSDLSNAGEHEAMLHWVVPPYRAMLAQAEKRGLEACSRYREVNQGAHMPQFQTIPLLEIKPVELTDGTLLETPELTRIVECMKAVRAGGMVNMISRTDVAKVMLLLGWEEEADWLGDKAFRGRRALRSRDRVPYFELLNCLGGGE